MRLVSLLALLAAFAPAAAETWKCTNPEMEIACADGDCSAQLEHGFTPMDIAFNDEGDIYACAYSGCWEGRGEVHRNGVFLAILARELTWSTDPQPGEMREDVAILLDLTDDIALLKAGVFAQPLVCSRKP